MSPNDVLAADVLSLPTLKIIAVAAGAGAIGGLAHWLGAVTGVIAPEPGDTSNRSGWRGLAEVLVGAVAAVIMLYIIKPDEGLAVIAGSVMTGLFSRAVIAALRARAQIEIIDKARGAAATARDQANRDAENLATHLDTVLREVAAGDGGGAGGVGGGALMGGTPAVANSSAATASAAKALATYRARVG